ncbi:ADA2C-like protein [Mya arenaria]|uniref:ADA2C-like protein n=1 Tax=Mya arenaria TaxID=6604 RepID=A0ABY7E6T5_MYAAR|nr:ADA2C-like protein [Mya arenaria]
MNSNLKKLIHFYNDGIANNTTHFENTTVVNTGNNKTEFVPPDFQVTAKNIILAVVLTLMDIVTIFGNLLVLLSFAIERRLLQPFNLYILKLAVTDFFVAITAMIRCLDTGRSDASCVTASGASHGLSITKNLTTVAEQFCVDAVWTPPFIADRLQHNEDHFCIWEPSDNREFVIFVALIGHYAPCLVMVFSYLKVLYVMRRQALNVAANTDISLQTRSSVLTVRTDANAARASVLQNSESRGDRTITDKTPNKYLSVGRSTVGGASTSQTGIGSKGRLTKTSKTYDSRRNPVTKENGGNVRERRIFITLTYVLSSYLICWFPYYIVFDTYAWAPELVPGELYTFFFWMTYLNSTLNPFIYAYTSKELRQAFMKVFRRVYRCRP